jgi:hypothetical protein
MSRMFDFNPANHANEFAERGFVHIPHGLSEEFHSQLVKYVDDSFARNYLKDFARGDKQQAIFEFLEPEHYDELREVVAAICGVEAVSLTLSERHIKEYEPNAAPYPLAHKDRFGSEVAVGFSIRVPKGSTLVIYHDEDVRPNPFNSTAELRASFSPDMLPEAKLRNAKRIEIQDQPADVQVFRGNSFWHLREHGAGTTVLYLKLNTYNCDTLGEDPHDGEVRDCTLKFVNSPGPVWESSIPVLGRRVDYIQRRYSRDWSELFGIVIHGHLHTTISQTDFDILRAMDGQRSVSEIAAHLGEGANVRSAIRSLAQRGIVDLLTQRISLGQIGQRALLRAA